MDTPGFSSFSVTDMEKEEVKNIIMNLHNTNHIVNSKDVHISMKSIVV